MVDVLGKGAAALDSKLFCLYDNIAVQGYTDILFHDVIIIHS